MMGQAVTFDYYYGMQAEQYSFYRIPKLLFTSEYFKVLSCEAKVLYGLLLDRMSLSIKNRWFDDENRVYIIFTIDEVMELLSCGKQKAVKIMAELDHEKGIGLIEKKRLGLGKANIIYVKNFILQGHPSKPAGTLENGLNPQKYENQTSESMKSELQEVAKSNFRKYDNSTSTSLISKLQEVPESNCNYTDFNDTESSDTNPNHIISLETGPKGTVNAIDACREVIHDNIEYGILCEQYCKEDVDEMVELMLEVVSSKKRTIKLSGEDVNINIVKGRFMKLNYSHMQYVFECLSNNTTKIKNIKQYLLTVLYNAPVTINHYYKAEVQHDLYGG